MKTEIIDRPANTVAKLTFSPGDQITTEGGSMIAMTGDMHVETSTYKRGKGSVGKALKRLFAGESLFMNHYEGKSADATLYIAPTLSGDIIERQIANETIVVQGTSFLAQWGDVEMDTSWQGFKNIFSGEGLFWIKLSGTGNVLLNSFGAIYEVDVEDEYVVDTGHIVAFQDSLDFSLSKVGSSWMSSILGGEGIVCRFKGKGKVWCQSHNPRSFGMILGPMLRPA